MTKKDMLWFCQMLLFVVFWCWHDNFVVHCVNKMPKSFLSYLYKIFSLCFVHITKSRRKLENDNLLNLFA